MFSNCHEKSSSRILSHRRIWLRPDGFSLSSNLIVRPCPTFEPYRSTERTSKGPCNVDHQTLDFGSWWTNPTAYSSCFARALESTLKTRQMESLSAVSAGGGRVPRLDGLASEAYLALLQDAAYIYIQLTYINSAFLRNVRRSILPTLKKQLTNLSGTMSSSIRQVHSYVLLTTCKISPQFSSRKYTLSM